MTTIEKTENGEDVEKVGLVHCWWECRTAQRVWTTVWWFLKKFTIESRYDPAIPLLGIYKRTGKRDSNIYLYTYVRSSIIHNKQRWKQPKGPLTGE